MPAPSDLPPELLARPFTLSQARSLGVARKVLRGQRFRRPFGGVYLSACVPETIEVRADAARLLLPAGAVSHHTAAQLRHLPLPHDGLIHATVPPGTPRPEIGGIAVHTRPFAGSVTELDGRPVVTPDRNFLELAGHLNLLDLVVLGDAMVRRGRVTVNQLHDITHSATRQHGATLARRATTLVLPRVDSPMETRSRLMLVLAGLPCPEPGLKVLDEDGQWVATLDPEWQRHFGRRWATESW
ncbi:hypothetical protein [Actinopolymorpha alba]|uniref:hypothetical protein n=1 Tax=Actinopolymorpha alba TaxID=533267 RepID=UPI0003611842|nr:hypothetical protein [Actinopolymorpha alba]